LHWTRAGIVAPPIRRTLIWCATGAPLLNTRDHWLQLKVAIPALNPLVILKGAEDVQGVDLKLRVGFLTELI
jgi:hypothetical protein